jgi:prolyl-tRNA synthetase
LKDPQQQLAYSVHVVRVHEQVVPSSTDANQLQKQGKEKENGGEEEANERGVKEWVVVAPKGRKVNELKVKSHLMRQGHEVVDISVRPVENASELSDEQPLLVDETVAVGDHGVQVGQRGDFTLTEEKDQCAVEGCHGTLVSSKGIEVGHVFYLGTKYSAKLDARVTTPTAGTNFAEMVRSPPPKQDRSSRY